MNLFMFLWIKTNTSLNDHLIYGFIYVFME